MVQYILILLFRIDLVPVNQINVVGVIERLVELHLVRSQRRRNEFGSQLEVAQVDFTGVQSQIFKCAFVAEQVFTQDVVVGVGLRLGLEFMLVALEVTLFGHGGGVFLVVRVDEVVVARLGVVVVGFVVFVIWVGVGLLFLGR